MMPEKDPLNYQLLTYGWVFILSTWAGIASYTRKIREGKRNFSFFQLVGEICISGFVGILTFFMCEAANIPQVMSAAIIGISAHMGSRAILMLETMTERLLQKVLQKYTPKTEEEK